MNWENWSGAVDPTKDSLVRTVNDVGGGGEGHNAGGEGGSGGGSGGGGATAAAAPIVQWWNVGEDAHYMQDGRDSSIGMEVNTGGKWNSKGDAGAMTENKKRIKKRGSVMPQRGLMDADGGAKEGEEEEEGEEEIFRKLEDDASACRTFDAANLGISNAVAGILLGSCANGKKSNKEEEEGGAEAELGFATNSAVLALGDVISFLIGEIGTNSRALSALSGRTEGNILDVLMALSDIGMHMPDLSDYLANAPRVAASRDWANAESIIEISDYDIYLNSIRKPQQAQVDKGEGAAVAAAGSDVAVGEGEKKGANGEKKKVGEEASDKDRKQSASRKASTAVGEEGKAKKPGGDEGDAAAGGASSTAKAGGGEDQKKGKSGSKAKDPKQKEKELLASRKASLLPHFPPYPEKYTYFCTPVPNKVRYPAGSEAGQQHAVLARKARGEQQYAVSRELAEFVAKTDKKMSEECVPVLLCKSEKLQVACSLPVVVSIPPVSFLVPLVTEVSSRAKRAQRLVTENTRSKSNPFVVSPKRRRLPSLDLDQVDKERPKTKDTAIYASLPKYNVTRSFVKKVNPKKTAGS
eukprot:Nk52_evm1s785 gene=Nk52_evmTU1s785